MVALKITQVYNKLSVKMVAFSLKPKEDYKKINPVIVVAILDFEYFKFDEYITKGVMVADKHIDEVINKVKIFYYIELPKFRKSKIDENDKVSQWLTWHRRKYPKS